MLKACDIYLEKSEIKELAQQSKTYVQMPTEAAEDGVIVEDLIHILWKVLNFNQDENQTSFLDEINDKWSCGSFTDSEELDWEYKEKLKQFEETKK